MCGGGGGRRGGGGRGCGCCLSLRIFDDEVEVLVIRVCVGGGLASDGVCVLEELKSFDVIL